MKAAQPDGALAAASRAQFERAPILEGLASLAAILLQIAASCSREVGGVYLGGTKRIHVVRSARLGRVRREIAFAHKDTVRTEQGERERACVWWLAAQCEFATRPNPDLSQLEPRRRDSLGARGAARLDDTQTRVASERVEGPN